jgi:hypothetical protein
MGAIPYPSSMLERWPYVLTRDEFLLLNSLWNKTWLLGNPNGELLTERELCPWVPTPRVLTALDGLRARGLVIVEGARFRVDLEKMEETTNA